MPNTEKLSDILYIGRNYPIKCYFNEILIFLGNVVNAVHHARVINREIRLASAMDDSELFAYAKQLQVPVDLLRETAKLGRLPVVNFAAGGLGNKTYPSCCLEIDRRKIDKIIIKYMCF